MSPSSDWPSAGAEMRTEQALLQSLSRQSNMLVIASTVRAARALRLRYNEMQRASGLEGWRSPQILAWEPWLETLWDAAVVAGVETRLLLTDTQELELWRDLLAKDKDAGNILSISSLAELAQRVWKQMHQYKLSAGHLQGESGLDAQAFARWAAEFEKSCRQSSFLSSSWLDAAIAQHLAAGKISAPEQIVLLGFDRITPAQVSLIEALRVRGRSTEMVEMRPAEQPIADPVIACAQTIEDEIASAAHWIRRKLLENPKQRIGVIVPELDNLRGAIDAAFRRVLAPSSMDVRTQAARLPYEFSLGTPLRRLPAIRTALMLLRWLDKPITADEVSWLTVHGVFSAQPEGSRDARARLDREFRERDLQLGGPVSLARLRGWLAHSGRAEDVKDFRRSMEHLYAWLARQAMSKSRSFGEWREAIEEALDAVEWRLLAPKDSAEYQLQRRWSALLDDLSSLSSVAGPVQFSVVLERLEQMAAGMLFALETRNAPVQIMGVAESAGIVFDSVWWMNAQSGAWPARGKAQPFLPWGLQREAHMPFADPAEDYAFAIRATRRVLNSGKQIVVSFAMQQSDDAENGTHTPDREIAMSPLLREILPDTSIVAMEDFLPESAAPGGEAGTQLGGMQRVAEELAVPFEQKKVRGGVRFLELHAACPFHAFAELRLGAYPLQVPETGLSPRVQGDIVHRVLDRFWNENQSQKKLLEKTSEELRDDLRLRTKNALRKLLEAATEPWQQALVEIEAERIEERLLEWLEQEKRRPDFKVLQTESILDHGQIGGIELRCRIDRIDEVAQGVVLLDYKTGQVDKNSCEGDRPDHPQLPAYAVLRDGATAEKAAPLAGIAFAGLHPQKTEFTVVGALAGVFAKAPDAPRRDSKWKPAELSAAELQEMQARWSATLTRLAEEFRLGTAIVDPKRGGATCKYCAVGLLCRVRETTGSDDEEREESSSTFHEEVEG